MTAQQIFEDDQPFGDMCIKSVAEVGSNEHTRLHRNIWRN